MSRKNPKLEELAAEAGCLVNQVMVAHATLTECLGKPDCAGIGLAVLAELHKRANHVGQLLGTVQPGQVTEKPKRKPRAAPVPVPTNDGKTETRPALAF